MSGGETRGRGCWGGGDEAIAGYRSPLLRLIAHDKLTCQRYTHAVLSALTLIAMPVTVSLMLSLFLSGTSSPMVRNVSWKEASWRSKTIG